MFDAQPRLAGELVELRPLRADDREDLYAAASDPLIWEQHPEKRNQPDVFNAYFADQLSSGGGLAVVDRAGSRVIGTTRFAGFDANASEVEIGWTFLARPYWGGGYNGEMKTLLLGHAFRFVDRVVFAVHEQNIRSQRAVEKIGGRRVGSRVDAAGRGMVVFAVERQRSAASLSA